MNQLIKNLNRDYYNSIADEYSLNSSKINEYETKEFLDVMKDLILKSNKDYISVLDLCSGTGFRTKEIFKISNKVRITGVDISNKMLQGFYNNVDYTYHPRLRLIESDVIEFLRNTFYSFDIILIQGSLHHIVDYEEVIRLVSLKLNKDGFFFLLSEPLPTNRYNTYLQRLIEILDKTPERKNNLIRVLYILYSPFNFLTPLINSRPIRKIKESITKDKKNFDSETEKNIEYWVYNGGLESDKILNILKSNDMIIVSYKEFSLKHNYVFFDRLLERLNIVTSFSVLGNKQYTL